MKPKEFEYFVEALKSLPSISTKSANKIAYFFLENDEKFYNTFLDRLVSLKSNIKFCMNCNNLTSNSLYCEICNSSSRDSKKLCIVSYLEDLEKIEQSNSFSGLYFVLNSEINHKDLSSVKKLNFEKLETMINKFHTKEILICTNMTINGELTSSYIKNFIKEKKYNIELYRLAMGIPMNASIEYIDWESLKHSIENKKKI